MGVGKTDKGGRAMSWPKGTICGECKAIATMRASGM